MAITEKMAAKEITEQVIFPMAPTKQVTYRATPAITEITAVAVMPATYQEAPATFLTIMVAPAKQAMYQTVTEAPATCPVPTAKYPFPAMTLRYTVRPQPAPLRWKETAEAILMMRKKMSSR